MTAVLEAAPAALDLHKGIGTAGCPRWPDNLRLQSTLGALVPGRCKATNLCDYCAKLAAVENSEVLAQDAVSNSAPAVWTVLSTRSTVAEMAAYKVARMAVRRAVRRRWPDAEVATLVEFTTGLGKNSEGQRRPHWNDMWKAIPISDVDELQAVTAEAWCGRVDALPKGQYAGAIAETGGLMRYLALHFQKESQQPPEGWRSHRFNTSRGYLAVTMPEAREQARASLRKRRELWKIEQQYAEAGVELTAEQLYELSERAAYEASELSWELVRRRQEATTFLPNGWPIGGVDAWEPVR